MQNWTMHIIRHRGSEAAEIHSWQKMWYFDNQSQFDSAFIDYLRDHFQNTWFAGLSTEERRRIWPEHYMFLVIDKEALESVRPLEVELPRFYFGEYPYCKVWDKDAPPEDSDYPEWMKVRLPEVFNLYGLALQIDVKNMQVFRSRSTDWFSRDLIWYDDDHYGDREEEIDSEEHEGSN